jgi:hypothetical protein
LDRGVTSRLLLRLLQLLNGPDSLDLLHNKVLLSLLLLTIDALSPKFGADDPSVVLLLLRAFKHEVGPVNIIFRNFCILGLVRSRGQMWLGCGFRFLVRRLPRYGLCHQNVLLLFLLREDAFVLLSDVSQLSDALKVARI